MNILEYYYKKIIKHELINKFYYKNLKEIPQIKKIVLNFGCKNSELKTLAASVQSLNLISSSKKIILTKSRRSNIFIKIRKGQPIGCKVILEKRNMYTFFLKLLTNIIPELKEFKGFSFNNKLDLKSFSFTIKELITFKELENHFYLFNNLPILNITIITNVKTKKELLFLLYAFKIPVIKIKKLI